MAGLYFEEFEVGREFHHEFSRTVTEMDNTMFSLLTMNPQPLHIDAHFSENTEFGQRLFNSLYTLGIMIGMSVYDTTLGHHDRQSGHDRRQVPKAGVSRRYAQVAHQDHLQARQQIAADPGHRGIRAHHDQSARRGGGKLPPDRADALQAEGMKPMRSFLFVPGDSQRKFENARKTAADALILDLEDSIAPDEKVGARRTVREMLDARNPSQKIYVRVNALDTDMTLGDLAAVMPGRPDGIVLPKCAGAADVNRLSLYLDAFEAAAGIEHGSTRIVTVATETARAVLKLLDFENMSPRLWGMMWGAEDLAASLGASRNRTAGRYHGPFLLARDLCLISAAAAGVVAIDTIATDINDLDALREEAIAARQDGFLAKAVIHPKHVDVVNAAFMPTDEEIAWSEKVVKAFNDNPTSGVVKIDGKMIDKPHLRAAEKILALRGR